LQGVEKMKLQKIDHICFAVRDVEKTKEMYREAFGLTPDAEYLDQADRIKVARYYIGEVAVEFIEPTGPEGEVARFIEKKGEGFFLISYKVDDLNGALSELREKNVDLIDDKPRRLLGTRYAFIFHPNKLNGVLTELLEGAFDLQKD
jgi:methylmalonyl-CoA/ethylmalonyl-CoA epimerase